MSCAGAGVGRACAVGGTGRRTFKAFGGGNGESEQARRLRDEGSEQVESGYCKWRELPSEQLCLRVQARWFTT